MPNHPIPSAVDRLIEGYRTFKKEQFEDSKAFCDLVEQGQRPKILAIACCDSRVDPAIVTNCRCGEVFVVRNVANLVPPYSRDRQHHGTSAALEFGVLGLGVTDIIVFGHRYCGGIRALMENTQTDKPSDFIQAWMNIAEPAKQQVLQAYPHESLDEQAHHCEKASLITSLNHLSTFPWIAERVQAGQLYLHAWYFDLDTGNIEAYQADKTLWQPL